MIAPKHGIETTKDACSFVNGPASNGAFSPVSMEKLGPAQVDAEPYAADSKLPVPKIAKIIFKHFYQYFAWQKN